MATDQKYEYYTCCVHCSEPSELRKLNQMISGSVDVSRKTFMRHCGDSARETFRELGYAAHPKQGLTSAADYHISYHKSKWGKRRCYYFCWSAIEHVFLP